MFKWLNCLPYIGIDGSLIGWLLHRLDQWGRSMWSPCKRRCIFFPACQTRCGLPCLTSLFCTPRCIGFHGEGGQEFPADYKGLENDKKTHQFYLRLLIISQSREWVLILASHPSVFLWKMIVSKLFQRVPYVSDTCIWYFPCEQETEKSRGENVCHHCSLGALKIPMKQCVGHFNLIICV